MPGIAAPRRGARLCAPRAGTQGIGGSSFFSAAFGYNKWDFLSEHEDLRCRVVSLSTDCSEGEVDFGHRGFQEFFRDDDLDIS